MDKRVNIRIKERVQTQSVTGFMSKWKSLPQTSTGVTWQAHNQHFSTCTMYTTRCFD